MNKQTKLVLSIIGASAIIVPVVLLVVLTRSTAQIPQAPQENRSINTKTIEDAVKKAPKKETIFPTPSTSTPSAKPSNEGSSSSH